MTETAGTLVIEKYYYVYESRRNETAVILWKNNSLEDRYSHFRDLMLPKDLNNSAETARRILFEQSRGLLYCTDHRQLSDMVLNTSTTIHLNSHTCYCFGINSGLLFGRDYYQNKEILDNGDRAPMEWKQTHGLARFYISDLIQHGVYGDKEQFSCPDANGEVREIDHVTKDIIAKALQNKIVTVVYKSPKEFAKIKHQTTDYLSGITSLLMLNY